MASATTQGILDLGIAGLVAKPKDFQTGCSWKFEISWLTSLIFQEKFLRRWRIGDHANLRGAAVLASPVLGVPVSSIRSKCTSSRAMGGRKTHVPHEAARFHHAARRRGARRACADLSVLMRGSGGTR